MKNRKIASELYRIAKMIDAAENETAGIEEKIYFEIQRRLENSDCIFSVKRDDVVLNEGKLSVQFGGRDSLGENAAFEVVAAVRGLEEYEMDVSEALQLLGDAIYEYRDSGNIFYDLKYGKTRGNDLIKIEKERKDEMTKLAEAMY